MYRIRLWFGISVRDSGSLLICKGGEPFILKLAHASSYSVEGSVGKTHQLDSSGCEPSPKTSVRVHPHLPDSLFKLTSPISVVLLRNTHE